MRSRSTHPDSFFHTSTRLRRAFLTIISTLAARLVRGAAIHINAVEHPARLSCGRETVPSEFAPSYRRATFMQAPLAALGCVAGVAGGRLRGDMAAQLAALLLGAVVPFTLVVMLPTSKRLLGPALHNRSAEASALLCFRSNGHWMGGEALQTPRAIRDDFIQNT